MQKPKSRKEDLKDHIRNIFETSRQIYGSHRITIELNKCGRSVSRAYVGRLMQEMGIRSRIRRKFVATTDSKHSNPVAENLLDRKFSIDILGKLWVSDITYIRLKEHWVYLTVIIDLADRAVVGWNLSEDMTTENTVVKAWNHARNNRTIVPGFLLHSDRGVQYTSKRFIRMISMNRYAKQSMSRKGNCWDNSVAESFFKTIKYEELNHHQFHSFEQLKQCIQNYIWWYNTQRIHSSLEYQTPLEREIRIRNLNEKWAA